MEEVAVERESQCISTFAILFPRKIQVCSDPKRDFYDISTSSWHNDIFLFDLSDQYIEVSITESSVTSPSLLNTAKYKIRSCHIPL